MYPLIPFEDCLEKITYTTKIQRKDFLESGDFPIVSQEAGDINGYWNNESDVFEIKKPVIIFGDHTKIIKYIDFDFVLGADGVKILQPKDSLDTRYFFYFLQGIELKSLGYARHYRLLRELSVPIPPLSTQLDIVTRLDSAMAEIEAMRAETESALESTRELWESTLESIFASGGENWEEKKLPEIVGERCTLGYGIVQPGEEFEDGIPIVRPTDLTRKFIYKKDLKLIDPKLAISYKRTTLQGNELLLCVRGNTGIVSIATEELKDGNVTRGIVPIAFNADIIEPEFGYYQFISTVIQKQIKEKTYGTALLQINIGDLRMINIVIPPLSEQSNIVAHLDTVRAETERLEHIYTEKLASLDELRRSVLSEAFL